MPKPVRRTSNSSRLRKALANPAPQLDPAPLPPPSLPPPPMPELSTITKTRTRTSLEIGTAVAFLLTATAAAWLSSQDLRQLKRSLPDLSQAKKLSGLLSSCSATGPSPDLRIKSLSQNGQQLTYTVENVGTSTAPAPTIMEIRFLGDPDNMGSWSLVTTSGTTSNQAPSVILGNCGTWTNTVTVDAPNPLPLPLQGTVVNPFDSNASNNLYMLQ